MVAQTLQSIAIGAFGYVLGDARRCPLPIALR